MYKSTNWEPVVGQKEGTVKDNNYCGRPGAGPAQTEIWWYNDKAREKEIQPGDMVLLLLPSSTCKLLAQWQLAPTVWQRGRKS